MAEPIGSRPGPAHAARTTQAGAWRLKPGGLLLRAVLQGRFTKAQNRKFFHAMTAQKSYYVSATAIIIENCNNGLRNRKLDFTRYAHVAVISDFEKVAMHAISQMLSVVSVLSTSANLGGAEFRPLVCQTRTRLFRSGWCCFSDCRCCLRMKSAEHLLTK